MLQVACYLKGKEGVPKVIALKRVVNNYSTLSPACFKGSFINEGTFSDPYPSATLKLLFYLYYHTYCQKSTYTDPLYLHSVFMNTP